MGTSKLPPGDGPPRASPVGARPPAWWAGVREVLESIAGQLVDQPEFAGRDQLALALEEPPVLGSVTEFGGLLLKAGKVAQAERLYSALAERLPTAPAGQVGLARTAMRGGSWLDALAFWDQAIRQFPNHPAQLKWLSARASVLVEVDRKDDALQALRTLMESTHTNLVGLEGLARLAMRCNWWPEALEWSEALLDSAGEQQSPQWIALRAQALSALGRLDDAEQIFRSLMAQEVSEALGMVGLAAVLGRRHLWRDALAVLDAAFVRFADGVPPHAEGLRARVLFEVDRIQEAEAEFRRLIRDYPGSHWTLIGLCNILQKSARPEEVLSVLESSESYSIRAPGLIAARLRSLITLWRLPEARADFLRQLKDTDDPAVLVILFEFTPELFEGWQRTEMWLALGQSIDRAAAHRNWMSNPSLSALRLRLFLALRNYDAFLAALEEVKDTRLLGVHEENLLAVAAALRRPQFMDYERPRIFGIGLSKTGTTSLAVALEELGIATIHWSNPLTGELMNDNDLHLFDAFIDTPCCLNFEKYYYMFPNAKFIYTVRQPDDWEKSCSEYFKNWQVQLDFQRIRKKLTERDTFHFGAQFADIHMALYFNHKNFAEAFQVYDRRVRRFFEDKSSDRLLVFDIFAGDAWQKLCEFLGRDIPAAPFPWENRAPPDRTPAAMAADSASTSSFGPGDGVASS
jgi:tetratricopeptide (TPR) repeat protein